MVAAELIAAPGGLSLLYNFAIYGSIFKALSLVSSGVAAGAPTFCAPARSTAKVRPSQKRHMGRWLHPDRGPSSDSPVHVLDGSIQRPSMAGKV
jgi:hypothetical protein